LKRKIAHYSIVLISFLLTTILITASEVAPDLSDINSKNEIFEKVFNDKNSEEVSHTKKDGKESEDFYLYTDKVNWFDEHGLQYSKLGEFEMEVSSSDDSKDIYKFPADIWMYEDFSDCEDGYKKIMTEINIYKTNPCNVNWWISYFDAYTGMSYEYTNSGNSFYEGCYYISEGDAVLKVGKDALDIHMLLDSSETDERITYNFAFTVPSFYDGLVIQLGPNCEKYMENKDSYKIGEQIYYADDFTNVNDDYLYFSLMRDEI